MDDENAPRLKRRRLDPSSCEAGPRGSSQQESPPISSQASASSHPYPVVHLNGNSQAIFGDIGDASSFFRNGSDKVSKRLLLNALYFEGMQSRRDQIAARAGSPKYIEWVWTTSFNTWLQSSESFYWITGCPGSGKSTLMKHISESRQTLSALKVNGEEWTTIYFFFDFRAKVDIANTIDAMLRSLLYQIIKRLPEVAKHFESTISIETLSESGLHDYMDNLCDAIQQTSTRICAFIDGLDEFDGPGSELLDAIYNLEDRSGIKICMASRPYPVFQDNLAGYQHLVMQDHNYQSIQLYTEAQFKSSRFVGAASLPRDLADKIREKARGVFLWARLATDELLRDLLAGQSIMELEQHLNQMPAEVQQMYQRILYRLPEVHKMEAALLLYILTVSEGAVEVRKVFVVMQKLASKLPTYRKIQSVDEDDDNDSRLLALLGDFVDVSMENSNLGAAFTYGKAGIRIRYRSSTTSIVRLTHETLYAYLTNNKWLEEVLGPHFAICYGPRFWFNLYLDELLVCLGKSEAQPPMDLGRFRSFLRKMAEIYNSSWSAHEEELDKSQIKMLDLMEMWREWTPLLPYALQEIFARASHDAEHPYGQRIDDLHRVLQSPISWLHHVICMLQGVPMKGNSSLRFCGCHGLPDKHMSNQPLSDLVLMDPQISTPLSHGMSSYLIQWSSKDQYLIPHVTKQIVFDFCWDKYMFRRDLGWKSLVLKLGRTSSHFEGKHLCQFLRSRIEDERWSILLRILKSCQNTQRVLSEHDINCRFYGSETPEAGFLCHWANFEVRSRGVIDENLTALFESISISQAYLNQISDPCEEPLLNEILSTAKRGHGMRDLVMMKTILALQAGANPYVVGKYGTAFDMARRELKGLRICAFDEVQMLQMGKIVELLEYYATHSGKLPQDLDEFLKFND